MALNNLLSRWIIIIVISIITIGVIIFLVLTEKILKKKVVIKEQKEENSPRRRIKLLLSTNEEPQNKLKKINAIAKEIFRNYYGIDTKLSYYELAEKFKEQGKQLPEKFCKEMFTLFYSGEKVEPKKINELIKIIEIIEREVQEEKSFKNLEKNMRESIKDYPQKIDLLRKFAQAEDKFIDKFARDKKEISKTQPQQIEKYEPAKIPEQKPIEFKTKTEKLRNLPLIKLFRFGKESEETLPRQEILQPQNAVSPSIKITSQLPQEKKEIPKEKSNYQIIEDLQKEVLEREKQIEKLRTHQQIARLEKTEVEVQINKDKSWPPVTFTPKHLDETRKMSPEIEKSFKKINNEIELLEEEINSKKHQMRKLQMVPPKIQKPRTENPSPIIKRFLRKITDEARGIDKEMSMKKKQINLINLKEEQIKYPNYSAPKIVVPKKQKINAVPKNKSLKKEEFIHHVDNMDRIRSKINERRAQI